MTMTIAPTIIGIDLGKNWFHLIGLDARGAPVLRKKLNRGQLATYAATAPKGVVATEACAGSQYWGRVFAQAGEAVSASAAGRRWTPQCHGAVRGTSAVEDVS